MVGLQMLSKAHRLDNTFHLKNPEFATSDQMKFDWFSLYCGPGSLALFYTSTSSFLQQQKKLCSLVHCRRRLGDSDTLTLAYYCLLLHNDFP
jgi:hypothetical protein